MNHPVHFFSPFRFNVKHPYGDYSVVGVAEAQNRRKKPAAAMAANRGEFKLFDSVATGPTASSKEKSAEREEPMDDDEESTGAKEDGNDHEEVNKPPIDLFKSIFLDSSSDEEDHDGDNEQTKAASVPEAKDQSKEGKRERFGTELVDERAQQKPWEEKKENRLRNPAPAAGIFANVDFDKLNRRSKPQEEDKIVEKSDIGPMPAPEASPNKGEGRLKASDFLGNSSDEEGKESGFGPARPSNADRKAATRLESSTDESSGEWVEAGKVDPVKAKVKKVKKVKKAKKGKKAKKSSAKKKKKRKKSKKKHKKRRDSSDSSSDDNSSSDSD